MKFLITNRISRALLILSVCLLICFLWLKWAYDGIPLHVESIRKEHIIARSVLRLSNLIFVHSDEGHVLFLDRKRYTGLRGDLPFYLDVPGKHAVIFATEDSVGKLTNGTIHYYDFDSKELMDFPCTGFAFGYGIGNGRDQVEAYDSKTLSLLSEGTLVSQSIKLDLRSGKVIAIVNTKK